MLSLRSGLIDNYDIDLNASVHTVPNNRESLRKIACACDWYGLKTHNV